MSSAIVLLDDEYTHVKNNDNGTLELIEGPIRLTLPPNKSLYSEKLKKKILKENQYMIIANPYDKQQKKCLMGEIEIRQGPTTFSLYPGESDLEGIKNATILGKNEVAVIQAIDNFIDDKGEEKKAGECWIISGPARYIPTKFERCIKSYKAINVGQSEAIYVRDTSTSELKLVKGPQSYILNVDEEEYQKVLSPREFEALKDQGITERASSKAFTLQIQKNECVCVIDYKSNKETYILGPKSHILGPYEGVKVISISAGVPKKENQAKLAIIRLGPDFMNDQFEVRTKDNAVLRLSVTYKWKFVLDDKNLNKIFTGDFIGYSCQSLRSRIREEAARHDFEVFHTSSSQILREKLFKKYELEISRNGKNELVKFNGRFFSEYSFLVFELEVKEVKPTDSEILKLLDESIKASMNILVGKRKDTAQNEAEKEKIENEVEIAELRKNLIEIENSNLTKETIEKAKIEGKALIEKAKAERQAEELLERSKMEMELEKMKNTMALLKGPKGDRYVEYVKAISLHKNVSSATIIPQDTKTLVLPSGTSGIIE